MQKTIISCLVLSLGLLSFTTQYLPSYQIAEDYSIQFSGRGANGTFSGLSGTIIFDPQNLATAKMDVSVDATTIETGNSLKDKHARGEDWFDVAQYPTITFASNSFSATDAKNYVVNGTLTLHGTARKVSIPFSFENNTFRGSITVNREDYGIDGPFISFTVADEFDVELVVPVTGS
ncbi:MAG: YceI family protein [Bacteroidota bacterium]